MTSWTDWEVVQHHVSICGRVLGKARKPMPGIQVSASPDANQPKSQSETSSTHRPKPAKLQQETTPEITDVLKQTESRLDGTFYFLDCADGQYTVTALDKRSGVHSSKSILVAESAMKKRMRNRNQDEGYQIELVLDR